MVFCFGGFSWCFLRFRLSILARILHKQSFPPDYYFRRDLMSVCPLFMKLILILGWGTTAANIPTTKSSRLVCSAFFLPFPSPAFPPPRFHLFFFLFLSRLRIYSQYTAFESHLNCFPLNSKHFVWSKLFLLAFSFRVPPPLLILFYFLNM